MFEYYYGNQTETFNFVRVPWVLFTYPAFAKLSNDAKMLYALLLDRMSLSRQNEWFDEDNRVYIIYTVEEAAATLNCCSEKASKLFKELDDVNGIGLITRKRRGLGKPSIIYVKNFIIDDDNTPDHDDSNSKNSRNQEIRIQDNGISELQTTENPVSCAEENRFLEPDNSEAIKNNIIKTDISNTEYQSYRSVGGSERDDATAIVNKNISYDIITGNNSSIADMITEIRNIMVDVICGDRQVIIGGKAVPAETAKSTFMKLTDEHILYVKAIVIYYSPEEWEIICKKANAAKLRNGTYIRRMSVKGEIKYYELKELMSLKRAFLSIGNNLNQIAEVANSTGSIYQKDIEDMQEEFKYFRSAMNHYTFEISPTLIH